MAKASAAKGQRRHSAAAADDDEEPSGGALTTPEPSAFDRLPGFLRFALVLARRTHEDQVLTLAAALSFVTVLSLIPLLAAFSFIGARLFSAYRDRILAALVEILPYSEATLAERIQVFLSRSEHLPQIGLVAFALVSLSAFGTLESILNRIWRVSVERPFKVRFLSFTMLLFWGPLLIGATFSLLLVLQQKPDFAVLVAESRLFQWLPFAAVVLGLTMLYWLVPYAPVRFRSALVGGVVAAAAFEGLRYGFGRYIEAFGSSTNLVYGGFAVALFFMLSIDASWLIVLLGCELAYLTQHPSTWGRRPAASQPLREGWAAVVACCLLVERFRRGQPLTALVQLEVGLGLHAEELRNLLEPLVERGVLAHPSRLETDVFLLGRDPATVSVASILAVYDAPREAMLGEHLPAIADRLATLQARLVAVRQGSLADGPSLDQLVRG